MLNGVMADAVEREAMREDFLVPGAAALVNLADALYAGRPTDKFGKIEDNQPLEFLLWLPDKSKSLEIESYARHIAFSLGAHLTKCETNIRLDKRCKALSSEIDQKGADIFILGPCKQTNLEKLVEGHLENRLAAQLQTSLWFVRSPIWPIKNILLILSDGRMQQSAVDWAVTIARTWASKVTVLPLILPLPAMYAQVRRMRFSMESLLASGSKLGEELRLVSQRMVNAGIDATLRIRQETPAWQIRSELAENDYDLVVIDGEPPNKLFNWIQGELVNTFLLRTDRSVLVAKPTI